MTTATHTPARWFVTNELGNWSATYDANGSSCYQGIRNEAGEIVALAVAQSPSLDAEPDTRDIASLIAAAPELLALLSKAVENAEQSAFEKWLLSECPSGDVSQVQDQWECSSDLADFSDEWASERAAIAKALGSTS